MDIVLLDADELGSDIRRLISDSLARAAQQLSVSAGEVAVRFVDSSEMTRLNSRWRGKEQPTDVLSFPYDRASSDVPIGDIAICTDVARVQAAEQRHSLGLELAQLALHGWLHLMGFDHETDDGEMDRIEHDLRANCNLIQESA